MKEGIFLGHPHTPGAPAHTRGTGTHRGTGCGRAAGLRALLSRGRVQLFLLPCAGAYGEMGIRRRFS